MEANGNGQGIAISKDAMIDALMERVQQLTVENVMLQAALKSREEGNVDTVPEGEMVHSGQQEE